VTIDRYHRQILLPQIGPEGQQRLSESTVLLIGCGALGSTIADQLTRAGVGTIRIADRDLVELTNLQRQVLFDEEDARQGLPKAIAAANRLRRVNSSVAIDPRVVDVDGSNIEALCTGVDALFDGTDNVATRYLINDISIKLGIPWVYGGCVGTEGRVMTVLPEDGPCLRCIFPNPPDARELATCDTAGVLGPVATVVGAMQALAGLKILCGNPAAAAGALISFDLWTNRIHSTEVKDSRRADCPACGEKRFEFLQARDGDMTARLCGRDAVQVRAMAAGLLSLSHAAKRLEQAGTVFITPFMVRCVLAETGLSITAFEDGRVIVQGTTDPARARSVVAKYLGS
jgi:adenylyltransferase/sulfurtransferase